MLKTIYYFKLMVKEIKRDGLIKPDWTDEQVFFWKLTRYFTMIVPAYYLKMAAGQEEEGYRMLTEFEDDLSAVKQKIPPEKAEEIELGLRAALDPQYEAYLKKKSEQSKEG